MAYNNLHEVIDELERRRQARDLNIQLRDASDPFQLPEELFRKLYRLSRESAFEFFNEITPFMEVSQRSTKIRKAVKFITAMHFFAHGSYQKSVGKDSHCSLSQAAVSRCLAEVVNIINEQLICDSNLKILSINARFPGSVHDSAIWMLSSINQFLQRNNIQNGDRTTWLLGDSGYPLQPHLLTPILGADTDTPEGRSTRRNCSVRNCVERCIGVLKAYFRCLHKDRVLHYKPPVTAKIIHCCAVLHNRMINRNDIAPANIDIEYENENNGIVKDDHQLGHADLLAEGRAVRNNLIRDHFA